MCVRVCESVCVLCTPPPLESIKLLHWWGTYSRHISKSFLSCMCARMNINFSTEHPQTINYSSTVHIPQSHDRCPVDHIILFPTYTAYIEHLPSNTHSIYRTCLATHILIAYIEHGMKSSITVHTAARHMVAMVTYLRYPTAAI